MIKLITDKDGKQRTPRDGEIIADGDILTVSMALMDSADNSRGVVQLSDAQIDDRRKMWDNQKQRLSDAWKNPDAFDTPAQQLQQQPAVTASDSYERYEQRLTNAWKASA